MIAATQPDRRTGVDRAESTDYLRRLHRRGQRTGEFEAAETRQIYRAAAAWLMTVRVFGDSEKARRFLTRQHALLSGRVPIEVAVTSEADLQALRELLGRLYFGSAA